MLSQLSLTFGSRQILQDIIDKYPDRKFKLMQASEHSHNLALFDFSNKPTVFKSPVEYTVLGEQLSSEYRGILYYQSFQVDNDHQKILFNTLNKIIDNSNPLINGQAFLQVDNKEESTTFVLLTALNDLDELMTWKKTDSFKQLDSFTTRDPNNTYYDEVYRPLM
ncbi:hypothetical protein [Limosilactobacillus fastidiosus]|uniref:Monooxygenase n=1 Tax=Limosilactobacillus fastidiosus TaxID=2759855 RepID=A0A7W3YBT9_9LACO|nr:hypothetical protein [Limosilactobacillus fastidiosus]MBB1062381.1 hypothetical protein [Limosilactobacillus fastidiosus]MBB1085292.1 hypothetical protein [Limosilactobacillus fastidiosus]MCD7083456.1 hypothetical protein [Limosilactobacillus fastidiosus]MCD7085276.1 hypothetical protein [Limosilactobacillus fastidiosus]MCD7115219.1 hypothetical protein [Limosilactobacillus fastidiosus]